MVQSIQIISKECQPRLKSKIQLYAVNKKYVSQLGKCKMTENGRQLKQ